MLFVKEKTAPRIFGPVPTNPPTRDAVKLSGACAVVEMLRIGIDRVQFAGVHFP